MMSEPVADTMQSIGGGGRKHQIFGDHALQTLGKHGLLNAASAQ